jgi:hypothetical protein
VTKNQRIFTLFEPLVDDFVYCVRTLTPRTISSESLVNTAASARHRRSPQNNLILLYIFVKIFRQRHQINFQIHVKITWERKNSDKGSASFLNAFHPRTSPRPLEGNRKTTGTLENEKDCACSTSGLNTQERTGSATTMQEHNNPRPLHNTAYLWGWMRLSVVSWEIRPISITRTFLRKFVASDFLLLLRSLQQLSRNLAQSRFISFMTTTAILYHVLPWYSTLW